jgi:hypothetical protein
VSCRHNLRRRVSSIAPKTAAAIYTRFWRGEREDKLSAEFSVSLSTLGHITQMHGPYSGPDYTSAISRLRRAGN